MITVNLRDMNKQKVIVTGGAGFIGTNFLHTLQQKYKDVELISVDIRKPIYPVDGVVYELCDVRDAHSLSLVLKGATKIFHLAAIIGTHESVESPYASFDTNVQGTINVLEYGRLYDVEIFIAGMPGVWNNPYSISKDAAVRMAVSYYETYGLKVCVLRWFSVYGPYQYLERYNKAVPTFINRALRNQPIPIYGDGNQVADFIFTSDAAFYAIGMLEKAQWGKVVQCASGRGISANELAACIIELCGSSSKIEHLPMRKGEPLHSVIVADTAGLKEIFPTHNPVDLREGLKETIEYYREYPPLD
jgi:nucleoside-diphosphate-sugar epimerase